MFHFVYIKNYCSHPTGAPNVQATNRRSRYGRHGPQPRAQHRKPRLHRLHFQPFP